MEGRIKERKEEIKEKRNDKRKNGRKDEKKEGRKEGREEGVTHFMNPGQILATLIPHGASSILSATVIPSSACLDAT
jgi:flagellar biosynthesis/type III secretory pathway protein FliH